MLSMTCCCGIGKSRTVQYWVGKLLQSGYTLTASSPTSKTQPANQKKKTAFHSRGHTPKLSVSCLHAISVVLCKHLGMVLILCMYVHCAGTHAKKLYAKIKMIIRYQIFLLV